MPSLPFNGNNGKTTESVRSLTLLYLLALGVALTHAQGETSHKAVTANLQKEGYNASACHPKAHDGIHLATFRWDEIGVYFTISAFVIVAGFAKLGFHKLKWLSSKVPESCLLVLLGLAVSVLIFFTTRNKENTDPCHVGFQFPQFTSETFFFILLPPIILDSAYSLHDRVFLDNLGTILLFAVIGTIFNAFTIGGSLYGVKQAGLIPSMDVTLTDAFVFSSLISAVDPVAVLAIFQELGVNQNLYFLIFGESLLNDGVTVVLYNVMLVFRRMTVVTVGQCFMAILSFLTVCFGAIFIGVCYGLFTAIMTKWTYNVRVVEPLAMLGLAYLSYLTAELFHFSGIICLIVCGLIQAHFGFLNISQKSYTCVKYFTKMASATSDTIIFMFLGIVLVNENHRWNTEFVLWSLFFCLIYRFISVFSLSALANMYRSKAIGFEEQFIAAYGGLRGAVAFSLATTLDEEMKERHTYIFTTLVVILFTIFIQGITIKPLVHLLNVQKRNRQKKNMVEEISESSMDHMMAGIEEILGHHGDFYLRELLMHYNNKYLKKWFLHQTCNNTKLTRLFEKIALSEHYAHLYGPVAMVEDHFKPLISFPIKDDMRMSPVSPVMQQEEMIYRASTAQKTTDNGKRPRSITVTEEEEPIYRPITVTLGKQPRKFSLASLTATSIPPTRRKSTRSLFNTRSVGPHTGLAASGSQAEGQNEASILRRALRENKYNKLHYTYNRNLVDEEDQEMTNHLSRRSLNAQRMSALASATTTATNPNRVANNKPSDSHHQVNLPGQVHEYKAKPVFFDPLSSSIILRQRHERRSLLQRERLRNINEGESAILEGQNQNSIHEETFVDIEGKENNSREGSIPSSPGNEEIPLLEILSEKLATVDDKPKEEV